MDEKESLARVIIRRALGTWDLHKNWGHGAHQGGWCDTRTLTDVMLEEISFFELGHEGAVG